ncbi:MAG: RNase adapter RapZ [Acidobacteria bacterium]|nr:RNase adapter RapZ [Acidobacteriota bacterium]
MSGAKLSPDGRFVILTGLSGSGKSQAIHALEDLGYFCVDNLPSTLIPTLADLTALTGGVRAKTAVVVDIREGKFLSQFPKVFKQLQADTSLGVRLIFLEATDSALLRRFSETRRPHPLARLRSPREGIRMERKRLAKIRRLADQIIDTSNMTVHELRRSFLDLTRARSQTKLVMTLLSFGFKYGNPVDADLLLDVRFLPNPHFVPSLRAKTGRSKAVREFLCGHPETKECLLKLEEFLRFLIPKYVSEGKSHLTVAIGCTGGRHRSVTITEALMKRLKSVKEVRLRTRHRDVRAD